MSKSGAPQREDNIVYLGYIEDGDKVETELTGDSDSESIAPWLVNKIGGLPIFPYIDSSLSDLETILGSMKCKHCKSPCVLIFQINSPIDESSFDRVMQVYTCVKSECIKHSWFAIRCMFNNNHNQVKSTISSATISTELKQLEIVQDIVFGPVVVCRERAFFEPYYLSVMEEPTGKENFARNNLEALKLASKFSDPDLKPAPIEEKYKNLKNYKPPKPPASASDLDDFEKFQMEQLYGNDKDMYRFYKRIGRYQAQVCRYDWDGEPLVNSNKIRGSSSQRSSSNLNLQNCLSCHSKRTFEFQLMSALINYLKTDVEFEKETLDFSSILVHSCSKNCNSRVYNLEDTYFMPDPDSRIFNKVKQRMLALKLEDTSKAVKLEQPEEEIREDETTSDPIHETTTVRSEAVINPGKKKNRKKKGKK